MKSVGFHFYTDGQPDIPCLYNKIYIHTFLHNILAYFCKNEGHFFWLDIKILSSHGQMLFMIKIMQNYVINIITYLSG